MSNNQLHDFISYAVAFLGFGLIGKWYLWPAVKDHAPKSAREGNHAHFDLREV